MTVRNYCGFVRSDDVMEVMILKEALREANTLGIYR